MKNILKCVFSASIMSAIIAGTAFAADRGWVQNDDTWSYYNNSGDIVTDTWKQSGDGWYYLNEDGVLAIDCLVESNNKKFYVDEHGKMIRDSWVAIVDEDTDLDVSYRWYYFGSDGSAYHQTGSSVQKKTINGKQYAFDADGKMLFGYVNDAGDIISTEAPILDAIYYFGSNEDGAMFTGWMKYSEAIEDRDDDYTWFYFNPSTGKKVFDTTKTIDGKKYSFNENGIMDYDWVATGSKYFSDLSDGSMKKKTWVHAIPSADINSDDYNEGTKRWFYVDYAGNTIKNTAKKINNKWYVFDTDGIMKTGIVTFSADRISNMSPVDFYDPSEMTVDNVYNITDKIYYFSNSESDGSMKTGQIKIELSDDTYIFGFDKHGCAFDGVKNSKLYKSGILQTAGDDKYAVATASDGIKYVVGSTGTVIKSGKYVKNSDDEYYAVTESEIKKFAGDDASKAAQYYIKNNTMEGIDSKYDWKELPID